MKTQTINRITLVGVLVLVGLIYVVSAVTGQPSEEDRPSSAGLRGAVAHAATASDPPRNLTVTVLGRTAINADWETPTNEGGSPITSYDLSYGPVGESPTIISVSDLYKIVTGLRPGTRYEFQVSARSSAGSSSWIGAFATTEEPGPTGQHHDTDISIRGLLSTIDLGGSDSFTVVAELEIGSHTISVSASGGVRFNSSCSSTPPPRSVENDGTNLVDHMYYWSLTLHGCNTPGGTVTASVSGAAEYRVQHRTGGSDGEWTCLDATTGTSQAFSPESGVACGTTYEFRVQARGNGTTYSAAWGTPSESASHTTGACNRAPVFDSATYSFSIDENTSPRNSVGFVSATDPDEGDSLLYYITAGNDAGRFAISGNEGLIFVNGALDYETVSSYTLTVEARDGKEGGTSSTTVDISVTDVAE